MSSLWKLYEGKFGQTSWKKETNQTWTSTTPGSLCPARNYWNDIHSYRIISFKSTKMTTSGTWRAVSMKGYLSSSEWTKNSCYQSLFHPNLFSHSSTQSHWLLFGPKSWSSCWLQCYRYTASPSIWYKNILLYSLLLQVLGTSGVASHCGVFKLALLHHPGAGHHQDSSHFR